MAMVRRPRTLSWPVFLWFFGGGFFLSPLGAAPPTVDALFPAGGKRGSEVVLDLVGKPGSKEKLQFWASDPGLTWRPAEEEGDEEAVGRLRIAEDATPGAHWIRFYNGDGSAAPQLFVVGELDERAEVEPNDSHLQADEVAALPVILNGKLNRRGDVDAFAVRLQKGEVLRAEVTAYRIDAPLDPLLRLTDAAGNVLSWNHDSFASLDPLLVYRAPRDGVYVLMLSGFVYPPQARSYFEGSDQTVYRMTLKLGEKERVKACPDEPEVIALATPICGVIDEPGAEDAFVLRAVKGETYHVGVRAQAIQSPLVGALAIRDGEKKELAKYDNPIGTNPELTWKAPADGDYLVTVRDLRRWGGLDFRYELLVDHVRPGVEVRVGTHAWSVKSGGTLMIPIELVRVHGHARPVTITLHGLPPFLSGQAFTIPGTMKNGQLIVRAPEGLEASSHVVSLAADDGAGQPIGVDHVFKGATTDQGGLLRNVLSDFLISVAP